MLGALPHELGRLVEDLDSFRWSNPRVAVAVESIGGGERLIDCGFAAGIDGGDQLPVVRRVNFRGYRTGRRARHHQAVVVSHGGHPTAAT